MVSVRKLQQKAAVVNSLIQDMLNVYPNETETLEGNYSELYSMILDASGENIDNGQVYSDETGEVLRDLI